MGVYVEIEAVIKSNDLKKKTSINLSGFSYSKWEHPLMALFSGDVEKYLFLDTFFKTNLSDEDRDYIKTEDDEEGMHSSTNWLDSLKFDSIISKFDSQKLLELSSNFEADDENGKIQFLTSFAKLQALSEIEKNKDSKIEITFIFG